MNQFRVGLLLCAASAAFNVDGVIALGQSDGPPVGVGIASIVLGLGTLAGVLLAWRGRTGGTALVAITRPISALALGVPAYFIGAPGWVYATVSSGIVLSAAGLGLMWWSRRAAVTA
jgi:hypothetical protein